MIDIQHKSFESICIKDMIIENHASHVPPIYATSTFCYDDIESALNYFQGKSNKHAYTRLSNPTTTFVASKIAQLEGYDNEQSIKTNALLFASGMAAIAGAVLSTVNQHQKVLTTANIYGTSNEFLQDVLSNYGVSLAYADLKDISLLEQLLQQDNTIRAIYIETPTNPTLACYDLKAIATIAQQYGVITIVDNTFATPYLQRPLLVGIDIVIHSGTKFLNGHGTGISGVLVTASDILYYKAKQIQKTFGAVLSPFEAYLLNNGIKTLCLRMQQHQQNAMALAMQLEQHNKVKKVHYLGLPAHPDYKWIQQQMMGFGGMLSFELDGNYETSIEFMKHIKFCTITATLGTADTLITHPASTSHSNVTKPIRDSVGITDSLIRVSVGLENSSDIIADIEQALSLL